MADDVTCVAVLVPAVAVEVLRLLGISRMRYQADLLREAVDDMLAMYDGPWAPPLPAPSTVGLPLRSVVFHLNPPTMAQLQRLQRRTRIHSADYLRRALLDLLEKHTRDSTVSR